MVLRTRKLKFYRLISLNIASEKVDSKEFKPVESETMQIMARSLETESSTNTFFISLSDGLKITFLTQT